MAPAAEDGAEQAPAPPDPYAERRTREKQDDYWEETFKSHTDKKPYGPSPHPPSRKSSRPALVLKHAPGVVTGPESVGLDILLHGLTHVYGLPERSTSLNLPSTRYVDAVPGGLGPALSVLIAGDMHGVAAAPA